MQYLFAKRKLSWFLSHLENDTFKIILYIFLNYLLFYYHFIILYVIIILCTTVICISIWNHFNLNYSLQS